MFRLTAVRRVCAPPAVLSPLMYVDLSCIYSKEHRLKRNQPEPPKTTNLAQPRADVQMTGPIEWRSGTYVPAPRSRFLVVLRACDLARACDRDLCTYCHGPAMAGRERLDSGDNDRCPNDWAAVCILFHIHNIGRCSRYTYICRQHNLNV